MQAQQQHALHFLPLTIKYQTFIVHCTEIIKTKSTLLPPFQSSLELVVSGGATHGLSVLFLPCTVTMEALGGLGGQYR